MHELREFEKLKTSKVITFTSFYFGVVDELFSSSLRVFIMVYKPMPPNMDTKTITFQESWAEAYPDPLQNLLEFDKPHIIPDMSEVKLDEIDPSIPYFFHDLENTI
jgi:hypothetical protein